MDLFFCIAMTGGLTAVLQNSGHLLVSTLVLKKSALSINAKLMRLKLSATARKVFISTYNLVLYSL